MIISGCIALTNLGGRPILDGGTIQEHFSTFIMLIKDKGKINASLMDFISFPETF